MSFESREEAMKAFNDFVSGLRKQPEKKLTKEEVLNEMKSWILNNFKETEEDIKQLNYIKMPLHPDRLNFDRDFRGFSVANLKFLRSLLQENEVHYFFNAEFENSSQNVEKPRAPASDDPLAQEEAIWDEKLISFFLNVVILKSIEKELDPSNKKWEGISAEESEARKTALLEEVNKIKTNLDAAKKEYNRKRYHGIRDETYFDLEYGSFAKKLRDLEWQRMGEIIDVLNEIENIIIRIRKEEPNREEAKRTFHEDFNKYEELHQKLKEKYKEFDSKSFSSVTEQTIKEALRKNPNAEVSSLGMNDIEAILREISELKSQIEIERKKISQISKQLNKDMDEGMGDQVLNEELNSLNYKNYKQLDACKTELENIEKHKNFPKKLFDQTVDLFNKVKQNRDIAIADVEDFNKINKNLFDPVAMASTLKSMQQINTTSSQTSKQSLLSFFKAWKRKSSDTVTFSSTSNLPKEISNFMKELEKSNEGGLARFEIARGYLNQVMLDHSDSPAVFKFASAMIETLKDKEKKYLEATDAKYTTKPLDKIPVKPSGACLRDYKNYKEKYSSTVMNVPTNKR